MCKDGLQQRWTAEGRYQESIRYSQEVAEKNARYRADARREKEHRQKLRLQALKVELEIAEADLSRIELEIAHLINKQLPSLVNSHGEQPSRFRHGCFFCAEDISVFARVCHHCKQVQPEKALEFFQKQSAVEKAILDAQTIN